MSQLVGAETRPVFAVPVLAAGAYTDGRALAPVMHVPLDDPQSDGRKYGGYVVQVMAKDLAAVGATLELLFLSAAPANTAIAANAAIEWDAADAANIIGKAILDDWTAAGDILTAQLAASVIAFPGKEFWVVGIVRGTPEWDAGADSEMLRLSFGLTLNG